ncbi:pseudouridylate synthase RPUSD2 isoform X1 [Lepeophtheirus salmonis]|nr:RNA pseudouridylate synthase domain-containing protein 2-like isoform X1 [Lepeophtheirus salmonis]
MMSGHRIIQHLVTKPGHGSFVQGLGTINYINENQLLIRPHDARARYTLENGRVKKKFECTFSPRCFYGPQYYFQNGLRFVHPYYSVMEFKITKSRLKSMKSEGFPLTLEGALKCLFPLTPIEFFDFKCTKELLWINFEPTSLKSQINESDLIAHLVHTHERPVLDAKLGIIYEDEDVLVVNKPPSLCISPSSTYKFNTLLFILAKEYGYHDLRPIHRLDKKTSGVLIFGKSKESASMIKEYFVDKNVQISKEYLALVDGSFPNSIICKDPISHYSIHGHSAKILRKKKESVTEFELIRSLNGLSLIRALPLTGRTHQIRIHLRNLGYPVVNDSNYNDNDSDDLIDREQESYQRALHLLITSDHPSSTITHPRYEHETYFSPTCVNCSLGQRYQIQMNPRDKMFICLHSWKYKLGERYNFEAPWPEWTRRLDYFVQQRRHKSKT